MYKQVIQKERILFYFVKSEQKYILFTYPLRSRDLWPVNYFLQGINIWFRQHLYSAFCPDLQNLFYAGKNAFHLTGIHKDPSFILIGTHQLSWHGSIFMGIYLFITKIHLLSWQGSFFKPTKLMNLTVVQSKRTLYILYCLQLRPHLYREPAAWSITFVKSCAIIPPGATL